MSEKTKSEAAPRKPKESRVYLVQEARTGDVWADLPPGHADYAKTLRALRLSIVEGKVKPGRFRIVRAGPPLVVAIETRTRAIIGG